MRSILAVTAIIEVVLNKLLFTANDDDYQIKSARYRLNGKVLRVEIEELSQPVTLIFSQRHVDVLANWAGDIHCTIKAPASVFLKLRDNQKIPALIRAHELEVEGDTQVLQQIVALNELIDWDLADPLSPYIGDVAAYSVSHNIQSAASFIKNLIDKQQANFKEVLKDEWLMLPNSLELVHLSDSIAELVHDVEAISNRVEKLNSNDDVR